MECTIQARLTVYFEEPFWVGVYERIEGGKLSAAKVTFGSEPKDYEVWAYFLRHYSVLRFSPAVEAAVPKTVGNPKRRQRAAAKLVRQDGIGTRAQQALATGREAMKTERQRQSRAQKAAETERQFALRQQKRKEKHKGH